MGGSAGGEHSKTTQEKALNLKQWESTLQIHKYNENKGFQVATPTLQLQKKRGGYLCSREGL